MKQVRQNTPKIICPGVSKTGTVSMTRALGILGWNILHYPGDSDMLSDILISGSYPRRLLSPEIGGISDLPASLCWRQAFDDVDDSLIVYTYRDTGTWMRSMWNHYQKNPAQPGPPGRSIHDAIRLAFWGFSGWNEKRLRAQKESLDLRVFDARSGSHGNRVLVMDLEDGDGWTPLCHFLSNALDREIHAPSQPFPHENRS